MNLKNLAFFLFVFLLPTQLTLHFWPDYALVRGVRVDYLAPVIYFTDILFLFFMVPYLSKNLINFNKHFSKLKIPIILTIILLSLNLFFSTNTYVTLFRIIKITQAVLLFIYVKNLNSKTITKAANLMFLSLIYLLIIGSLQVINSKTTGGLFYWLGERSFNSSTPGIALMSLGKKTLRAYATFPHPNAFAGFALVSFGIVNAILKPKNIKKISIIIVSIILLLTNSLAAAITLALAFIYSFHIYTRRNFNILILLFVVTSFFSPIIFNIANINSLPAFVLERVNLSIAAGSLLSGNPLFGIGLGTFTYNLPNVSNNLVSTNNIWLLQPVHNIYLLLATELGLLTFIIASSVIFRNFSRIKIKNKWLVFSLVSVLTTGLFDHYWLTINQNFLLTALLLGIIFSTSVDKMKL